MQHQPCKLSEIKHFFLKTRRSSQQRLTMSMFFFSHVKGLERFFALIGKWNIWSCFWKPRLSSQVVELVNIGDSFIFARPGMLYFSSVKVCLRRTFVSIVSYTDSAGDSLLTAFGELWRSSLPCRIRRDVYQLHTGWSRNDFCFLR